jgi:hypothetical protein
MEGPLLKSNIGTAYSEDDGGIGLCDRAPNDRRTLDAPRTNNNQ